MFVIPIYDMIILPEVTYYFKQDVFRELNLQEELKEDEEVVFLMLKEDRNRDEMRPEDFFPIGVSGKVEVHSAVPVGNLGAELCSALEKCVRSRLGSVRIFESDQRGKVRDSGNGFRTGAVWKDGAQRL